MFGMQSWFLGDRSLGQKILSHCQFRLTDLISICMFLIISQAGLQALQIFMVKIDCWLPKCDGF